MAKLKMFDALPPYLGGKRKLVQAIFKIAPPASEAPVFADAFLGGGAVSLMAKALGYQVHANDLAFRSYVVGKALIENNKNRIEQIDVARLFVSVEHGGFVRNNFSPERFLSRHADFLDNALAVVRGLGDGPKRWLSLYLLLKFCFWGRPYNLFRSPGAFHIPVEEQRFEHVKSRTYMSEVKEVLRPIPEAVRHLANGINTGIIDNVRENTITQGDALDFIRGIQADVLYLDPPYAGTSGYEHYHVLDQVLEGRLFPLERGKMSAADGHKYLAVLFSAADHIPNWILSYGNAGGKNEDKLREIEETMARYRVTKVYKVRQSHFDAHNQDEHREKNREYIILGVRP